MKREDLMDALGRVDEDLLAEAQAFRERPKGCIFRYRGLTAAACAVLLAGTLLTVEATSGSISNLLAPVFGMAQTELVDSIGEPIGVSATAGGYTLSADAVVGDRYNMIVVYTLTRDDGQPIPEGVCFGEWHTDVTRNAGGGGSLHPVPDPDRPDRVHFVESWSVTRPLIGRYVTASFSDLRVREAQGVYSPLAEGTWELSYTLRYQDVSQKLPIADLSLTDRDGKQYRILKGSLSPVGFHLEGQLLDPVWGAGNATGGFGVELRLTDGTVQELEDLNTGVSFSEGDRTAEFSLEARFPLPIPLDAVEAIILCGTEIALS